MAFTGIGPVLGAVILSEIRDIACFASADKLAAYAGLDPKVKQSGETKSSAVHMSKRGPPYLRRAIWLASTTAVQYDPMFKAYYEAISDIQEAEQLLERRREKERQCQRLIKRFQQLQIQEDLFQRELETFQERLATYNNEELQRLDAEGGLEPYRNFLTCVQQEHPSYEDVAPLIPFFGTTLPLGITVKKIILPDEVEKIRSESQLELASEPLLHRPFPPMTDRTQLGTLEKTAYKQPKGIKALTNMCSGSAEMTQTVFEFLGSQFSVVMKYPTSRTEMRLTEDVCNRLAANLAKEGYIQRCSLAERPDQVLYNTTENGREIFCKFAENMKRSHKKFKGFTISRSTLRMENSADFVRTFENRRHFSNILDLDTLSACLYERIGASFIRVAE